MGIIKGYKWTSPENVFIESKEGLGLNPKVPQHLRDEKPAKKAKKKRSGR